MKISLISPYLSIDKLDPVELPDFTVVTGVNGSGKTHFLQGIKNKSLVVDGLEESQIVYFNYFNFFLEDETNYTLYQVDEERKNAWNLFESRIKNIFITKRDHFLPNGLYEKIEAISSKKSISIWKLTKDELESSEDYNCLVQYRRSISNYFATDNEFKDNNQAKSIHILSEKLNFFIEKIDKNLFLDLYIPVSLKQDFLPMQLGKIYSDYYMKWLNNETQILSNRKFNSTYEALSDSEFEKKHGPKPWIIVDSILERFNTLDYKLSNPEGNDILSSFRLCLTNKKNGAEVSFTNLSSGEKVLMALMSSIYKSSSDYHFPDILLLDEIDASLHPSMIKNMLDVINDVFVKNGTKVILVTHSPTTIAFAPSDSIFVINKQGSSNRIEKATQTKALGILTEGYATLDEGLTLLDQTSKRKITIFSEGDNILYLDRAIDLLAPEIKTDVEIISDIKDISGKDTLYQFFRLFSCINHKNKVIFVWDCDFDKTIVSKNNTFSFIFEQNISNQKVKNGIENLFVQKMFTKEFYVTSAKQDGGYHSDLNKKKFLNYILEKSTQKDFVNFKSFIEEIKRHL